MKIYLEEQQEQYIPQETEIGCGFCWDKRSNRSKELFFLDAANNMRICNFCPYCGREYEENE